MSKQIDLSVRKDTPTEKLLEKCEAYVSLLVEERANREGVHVEDSRIATETAERMFYLERRITAMEDQEDRWRNAIRCSQNSRTELQLMFHRLNLEFKLALSGRPGPIPSSEPIPPPAG